MPRIWAHGVRLNASDLTSFKWQQRSKCRARVLLKDSNWVPREAKATPGRLVSLPA